jgi:hypothetical protein
MNKHIMDLPVTCEHPQTCVECGSEYRDALALSVCTGCGHPVCCACWAKHSPRHYRGQVTIGGQPVSVHARSFRRPQRNKRTPPEQLRLLFGGPLPPPDGE